MSVVASPIKTRTKIIFTVLLLLVVAVGLLHSFTPTERLLLHDLYRRFSYFPIVVAAILFGVRGGLFFAACTSLAFIPHLYHFYHMGPTIYLAELPEILLYFGAGGVIGAIAGREKQLRQKYQALSRRLERSYKKLHKQATQLVEAEEQLHASQKLSALGQLSASLAHEVKNPLAAIRGAVEILADEFPEDHPKHEFGEILLKETSRLSSTVDEVLLYSKQKQPSLRPPQLEALPKIVEAVRVLLDNSFREKDISLLIELHPGADTVLLDADKMTQVFVNLLLNSCEAIEKSGTVWVRSSQDDSHVELRISDDGPGIEEGLRETIFTPFFTTRKEGTGLGLAISSRIVARYGGTLCVAEAHEGAGACFVLSLPIHHKEHP